MKHLIRMVMFLLAVLIAASCDINQPHETIEPQPEKVKVSMDVKSAADSSRITSGNIEFNGGRFTNKVMTTNGILDDSLGVQPEPVSAFAYAEGYISADTIQVDLTQDVNKTFYLTKEADDPDPTSPGDITVDSECVSDEAAGRIFGSVENGFTTIKYIDANSREVISEKEGFDPTDDQEFEFTDVSSGTYIVVASLENDSEPSESESVTLDCEIQEGPGKIDITVSSCSDSEQANGLLTITIENGADTLTTTRDGDIVNERYDVAAGEEIELTGLAAGDHEITAVKNGKSTQVVQAVTVCEVKEGPGKIDITVNSCSDPDQPNGVLAFTVENGADSLRVDQDRRMVAELSDIAPGEEVELTEIAAGDYKITAFLNDKQAQESETVTTCDQPQPPKARFSFGVNGLTVSFDASGSSDVDGEIVTYEWEFGDNTDGTGEMTERDYEEAGTYSVTLTVTDNDGLTDTKTRDVTPEQPNRKPIVDFSTNTAGITIGLYNESTDPDGDNLSCTWEFGDGNGSSEFNPGSHDYSTGGEYDITLTCVDPDGASDSETKTITVEETQGPGMIKELKTVCSVKGMDDGLVKIRTRNGFSSIGLKDGQTVIKHAEELPVKEHQEYTFEDVPAGTYTVVPELNGKTNEKEVTVDQCADPKARFTSDADGLTVQYDASASSTENGDIEQYEWDWKDDGTFDETTTDPQPSFEFNKEGPFTTRLRVTDSRGLTNETTGEVNPFQPNRAPEAGWSYESDGLTAHFQNESSDPDDQDLDCEWDLGDGETSTECNPSHDYSESGDYDVTLTVTDPDGASDSESKTITVEAPNKAPEAQFSFDVNGLTVSFDASGSSDEDGNIGEYQWEFGDGTTGTGISPERDYDQPGTYPVTLTVVDNDGATDKTTQEVHPFQPNRAPNTDWTYETDGLTAHFTNKSTDPDGDNLSCTWDFLNSDGSTKCNPSYTFPESGEYEVTLTTKDPDGASDSETKTITVEVELSKEYTHRISIFADEKVWVSAHKDRLEDKLMDHGGARPIMTEKDPFGTVRMKMKLKSDVNGHSYMRIFFNEDGGDYIQTPILDVESGVDGWTTVTVEMDADEFAGRARDLAGFRVIHGDTIDDTKPEGPDSVYFAKADVDGEVTFYWRVVLDNSQNAKMMNVNEDNYRFDSSYILK